MPDLKTILKTVMSFNVSGGMDEKGKDFSIAASGRHMSWEFNSSDLSRISNIKCKVDGKSAAATVCSEISWKPIIINAFGKKHTLPFDQEFLLNIFYTEKGAIQETIFWYGADLEPSLLLVFGFEYRNGKWFPVPERACSGKDFMPLPGEKPKEVKAEEIKAGKVFLHIRPPRIIVCLEFACTEPAINCEPTKTVSACRIHPQQYLVSSMPYTLAESVTHLMRPERNAHDHQHGQNPGEDEMVGKYDIGCYTDKNDAVPAILHHFPFWKGTFQYYNLQTKKEFCAVDAHGKAQILKGKTETWNLNAYEKTDVVRLEKQGMYDNLHIAAGIKPPAALVKALSKFKGAEKAMELLHMAPSCVHDCLHFHWRWGTLARLANVLKRKRYFGWDANYPFQVPGAPMVPLNQTVHIKPLQSRGFDYKVEIDEEIQPGKWQYIFHHGVYYPVSIDDSFYTGMLGGPVFAAANGYLQDLKLQQLAATSWGMFYFNARYEIYPEKLTVVESCKFNLEELGG